MDSKLRRLEIDYLLQPDINTIYRLNSARVAAGLEAFLSIPILQELFEGMTELLDNTALASRNYEANDSFTSAAGFYTFEGTQRWLLRQIQLKAFNVFGHRHTNAHLEITCINPRYQTEISIYTDDDIYLNVRVNGDNFQDQLPLHQEWVYSPQAVLDFACQIQKPKSLSGLNLRPNQQWTSYFR